MYSRQTNVYYYTTLRCMASAKKQTYYYTKLYCKIFSINKRIIIHVPCYTACLSVNQNVSLYYVILQFLFPSIKRIIIPHYSVWFLPTYVLLYRVILQDFFHQQTYYNNVPRYAAHFSHQTNVLLIYHVMRIVFPVKQTYNYTT